MQAKSTTKDPLVPFAFSLIIATIFAVGLNFGLFFGLAYFLVLFFIESVIAREYLGNGFILCSQISVCLVYIFMLQSRKKQNIENFIAIQSKIDSQKKLIEIQNDYSKQAKLFLQVAHDIRSPLAVLSVLVRTSKSVKSDDVVMLKNVVSRVQQIADGLLEKHRVMQNSEHIRQLRTTNEGTLCSIAALISLVDGIVLEKECQYPQVLVQAKTNVTSRDDFVQIDKAEFQKIVSNILENAVESIPNTGKICVSISQIQNRVELSFEDNGRGIPSEVLPLLGKEGVTFGKAKGNGFGLAHAIETLEKWSGWLEVRSTPGVGTTTSVYLPVVKASS